MSLYDIAEYGAMMRDTGRLQAYREALRRCIEPGATVLDVGTGTGLLALLACRLGAHRVYAVESSDAIQVAREVARANGLDDRIVFLHDASTRVKLPQPADIMVSDMRGILPFFGRHIPSIIDARQRLLRRGGALIPRRDEVWVAPVQTESSYDELLAPWDGIDGELDLSAARSMVTQSLHRQRFTREELLAEAQLWTTLDYATIDSPDADGQLAFAMQRDGRLHGWALWFDATLTEGVHLSNAPGAPHLIYGSIFLPLSAAVPVAEAEEVTVDLHAKLLGDDYVWRWDTAVARDTAPVRMSQSSFHGTPLTTRTLALAATDHRPVLSVDGHIDAAALAMIDGDTAMVDIARRLAERFPEAFDNERAALDRVAALARRYAE